MFPTRLGNSQTFNHIILPRLPFAAQPPDSGADLVDFIACLREIKIAAVVQAFVQKINQTLRDVFHDRLFQQVECHIHSIAQHTVRIIRLFKSILQTRYQQRQSLRQRRRPLMRHIFQPVLQP